MIRTRVGYAGGKQPDPTYRRIKDHTEVFQVDYDPKQISFEQLLDKFWQSHNPCGPSWSTQYKAILFYGDETERKAAVASSERETKRRGRKITTELKRLDKFYFAEDYHQKYRLRGDRRLFGNIRAMFDSERAFSESTVAAKVNAYLDGHLTLPQVKRSLEAVGLRGVGTRHLEKIEVLKPSAKKSKSKTGPTSKPTSRPALRRRRIADARREVFPGEIDLRQPLVEDLEHRGRAETLCVAR